MVKQHLKLAKEIQCRDFDALIARTTIVFMCYMFLAYQCRMETDHRTLEDLFYACCDEVVDISFLETLCRILTLATDRLKQLSLKTLLFSYGVHPLPVFADQTISLCANFRTLGICGIAQRAFLFIVLFHALLHLIISLLDLSFSYPHIF